MPLPEQTIAWLRQAARLEQAGAQADLDAIARLDALEARVRMLEATQHAHIEGPIDPSTLESLREPASIQRLEPMEPADDEPQTLHSDALRIVDTTLAALGVLPEIRGTLRRAIREPMEPAAAAAAPVATDEELWNIWGPTYSVTEGLRAIYDHGRAHGTPPAVVEALRKAEAALSGAALASSQAINALPAIRAALQLLGQLAPAAAPEPIESEAQPAEDAAPAEGLVERIAQSHMQCSPEIAKSAIREVAAWLDRRGNRGSANELREQCAISKEERGAMTEPLSPAAQPAPPIQALDPNRLWVAMHRAQERELADNPMADHAEVYSAMIRAVADWLDADKDADILSPFGPAGRLRVEADR